MVCNYSLYFDRPFESEEWPTTRGSGFRGSAHRLSQRSHHCVERSPTGRHSRSGNNDSTEKYRRHGGHPSGVIHGANRASRFTSSLEAHDRSGASSTSSNQDSTNQRSGYLVLERTVHDEESRRRSADDRAEQRPTVQRLHRSVHTHRDNRPQSPNRPSMPVEPQLPRTGVAGCRAETMRCSAPESP